MGGHILEEESSRTRPMKDEIPVKQLTNPEMAAVTVQLQLADGSHTIKLVRIGEEIQLWVCSHCGNLAEKLESVIADLPAKGPTKNLYIRFSNLIEQIRALEAGMTTGTVYLNDAYAEARQIAAHLRDLGQKYPQLSHVYETEAQKAAVLIRQDIYRQKYDEVMKYLQKRKQKSAPDY